LKNKSKKKKKNKKIKCQKKKKKKNYKPNPIKSNQYDKINYNAGVTPNAGLTKKTNEQKHNYFFQCFKSLGIFE